MLVHQHIKFVPLVSITGILAVIKCVSEHFNVRIYWSFSWYQSSPRLILNSTERFGVNDLISPRNIESTEPPL